MILVAEELGSLFFLLVAFSEEEAPVKGGLRMIAFEKSEDSFLLFAEIDLWLGGVKREYKMEFLPEKVRLSILIPFHIENSKLSAYYEKITLRCDGYDLPETMISMCSEFFPNTVFPAGFFADAIGNVVENACFSG